jgi:OmpA-OmpF porin, OOP family
MVFKMIVSGILITIPTIATAQAGPVAVKSEQQIVCELTGDCEENAQELATRDRGPDRALRFDIPQGAKKKVVPPAPGYSAPKARVAAVAASKPRIAPASAQAQPGRSTLSINFASGSSTIAAGSRGQAQILANALKAPSAAGKRFIVGGHTDSVGGREYNLELSKRRAEALVQFLVESGVDRARLQPEGYGFEKPVAGLSAKAAANRRVEIVKID